MHVSKGLLQCEISDGLFPNENTVSFKTANNERIELYVPSTLVQGGKLAVSVLDQDSNLGISLIRLPASPTNNTPVVTVPSGLVSTAVAA
jgi:hypothetical protein